MVYCLNLCIDNQPGRNQALRLFFFEENYMSFPTEYAKKAYIPLTPSSGGSESNYPVKITLIKGSGANSAGNIYLNNNCLDWPEDVRFYDADGNSLSFWREESDATDGTWWVKISSIPTGNNIGIWVYYGKATDSDASSGANTGALFDDFNGASLDTDKWDSNTLNSATIVQTGGNIEVTAAGTTGSGAGLTSKSALSSRSYAIEALIKRVSAFGGGEFGAVIGFTDKSGRDTTHYGYYTSFAVFSIFRYTANNQQFRNFATGGTAVLGSTSWATWFDKWVRAKAIYIHSAKTIESVFSYSTESRSLGTSTGANQLSALYVMLHYGDYNKNGYKSYFDWIFVRPYIYPEPAWASPSDELDYDDELPTSTYYGQKGIATGICEGIGAGVS